VSGAAGKPAIRLTAPLADEDVAGLRIGDRVLLSGVVYTARDVAHTYLVQTVHDGKPLPIDLAGAVIYYAGPTPAPPGSASGSAGPTTSGRMDPYTPTLLARGVKAMIGKGQRSDSVRQAITRYRAVYFAAIGGAGALIAKCIKSSEVVAYPKLGPEAIRKLVVKDFPLIVANDIHGGDLYEEGVKEFAVAPRDAASKK
jgi:fumarate hydratase subunit beta